MVCPECGRSVAARRPRVRARLIFQLPIRSMPRAAVEVGYFMLGLFVMKEKRMYTRVLSLIAILVLTGCEGVPKYGGLKPDAPASVGAPTTARRETTLAGYSTAIVKDIVIEERGLNNIVGADLDAFTNGKAEIIRGFGETFRESLQKKQYFDKVVSDGPAGNAVVIEPTATIVDPGMRTGMLTGKPSRIELTVYVADAATGKSLGSYPVSFATPVDSRLDLMTKLKRYFGLVANRAADGIATLR